MGQDRRRRLGSRKPRLREAAPARDAGGLRTREVSFVLRTPPVPYYDGAVQAYRNALNKGRRAGPVADRNRRAGRRDTGILQLDELATWRPAPLA